ncbi:GspH/FimT family pseudopilin [Halomonas sp. LES1]
MSGFTLLELMVTVALVAIIAMVGVPSWQTLVSRMQVESDLRSLKYGLSLARSEAVSIGDEVSLCPYPTGFNDQVDIVCGNDWQEGWVVYRGNNDTIEAGRGIWVHGSSEAQVILGGASRVTFDSLGTLSAGNSTWKICTGDSQMDLVLAPSGRSRVNRDGSGCS